MTATGTAADSKAVIQQIRTDMVGKTVLVTGATNGIGKVAARTLAALGARVVIVGRNPTKTAEVADEIGAASFLVADLSELHEVRRVATKFREREERLDVLLNDAGIYLSKRQETTEGLETTFALNYLAYFLLTQELLPLLTTTPGARVVNVSSSAHTVGKMHWDDLELRHGYTALTAYSQSKLAILLSTRELSRRLNGTGVTVNALNPGFVRTGFVHNNRDIMSFITGLLSVFAFSAEQGAQTSIYLASSPEVQGVSGGYFYRRKEKRMAPRALDDAAAARLWAVSEEYVRRS